MVIPTFALSQACSSFLHLHHISTSRTATTHRKANVQPSHPNAARFYAAHATFARPRGASSQPQRGSYRPRDQQPFEVVPGATYYTECGKCTAVYELDPLELGHDGRKVACEVCGNTWFQRQDRLRIVPDGKHFIDYPIEEKDQRMEKQRERRSSNDDRRRQGSQRRRANNFAVFVGNLPYDATEEALTQLISSTAQVLNVTIVKDRESGRSKGFGFVNVPNESDVRAVVDTLDGVMFNGRALSIREGNRN